MTETSGGETPAEHPEGDGFAVSAGATSQVGADDARAPGSGVSDSRALSSGASDSRALCSGASDSRASDSGAAGLDADEVTGPGGGTRAGEAERGSSDTGRLDRRARLQALAGVTVLGSDGAQVGRVRDIYVHDATGELAAIAVVRRQLSSRSVLIPTPAIAVLPAPHTEPGEPDARRRAAADRDADPAHPQALWLCVDAASARAGLRPPDTLHASPRTLREAGRAVGLEEATNTVGPGEVAGPGEAAGPEEAAAG